MMRTLAYILILMMAFAWNGCFSEPSAIDRLKKGYEDRINGLRLPARADPGGKETPKPDQTQNLPTQEKTQTGIDLSSLPENKGPAPFLLSSSREKKFRYTKGPALTSSGWLLHTGIRNSN